MLDLVEDDGGEAGFDWRRVRGADLIKDESWRSNSGKDKDREERIRVEIWIRRLCKFNFIVIVNVG